MTVSYFVRYEGEAADAFLRHYREKHVPILARWPGMRRVILHRPVPWSDPCPIDRASSFLIAELEFDSQSDLDRALASPQRVEARQDFEKFPSFEGRVLHQAMSQEEVFRSPWLDGNEEEA
ncbi:MAG: EthD family reductase [Betaproteobacteria bacterium]